MASNTINYGAQTIRTNMSHEYGGMYLDANSTAQVMETANTPIALRNFATGAVSGFTFDAGNTGAITAYADYSGTVAGTVLATSTAHGLTTGDYISIRGTTNYNGIFQITKVGDDSFYFTDTWVADDGASDFDQPSHLVAGFAGVYRCAWNLSCNETAPAGSVGTFKVYVNGTEQKPTIVQRKFSTNDVGAMGGGGFITLAVGDWIYLTASSSSTKDFTFAYGNLTIAKA